MKSFWYKYMKIWEKVCNIKIINSELIYNKKYLKAEKNKIPIILIDSVYRQDEKYYPKVILENFIHIFLEKCKKFLFLGFF